ncbi:MAG: transposase, partial [Pseudomonadota bacterium]
SMRKSKATHKAVVYGSLTLYLDCIHVKVRDSGAVRTKAVYLAIGVNMEGHKEVLGLWISQTEGAKFWPNYPSKPFESIEQARQWTLSFVQWYNHQHKHSGLKFVTPAQRHDGRAASILSHRKEVYEAAKQRYPERWSGATRNWELNDEVWLNPEQKAPEE